MTNLLLHDLALSLSLQGIVLKNNSIYSSFFSLDRWQYYIGSQDPCLVIASEIFSTDFMTTSCQSINLRESEAIRDIKKDALNADLYAFLNYLIIMLVML